ncbi:MAG: hypothetical protein WDN72_05515 [Alphaproteobacteria bacterium]
MDGDKESKRVESLVKECIAASARIEKSLSDLAKINKPTADALSEELLHRWGSTTPAHPGDHAKIPYTPHDVGTYALSECIKNKEPGFGPKR